jgi:2-polyprenyl-3-methyl-5-hydroxy-6-metoxy-1,4-benzoquinol methylase
MRLALRAENAIEWLALRLGLVPTAAAEAWGGMALSAVLIAATRLGVTARLAQGPASVDEIIRDLGLDPTAARLLLDNLASAGYLVRRTGRYRLTRRARRWLAPDSDLSVARFVAGTGDYWQWWAALPEVARSGTPFQHHDIPPDDPYWRRYLTGQFELSRLSAGEVARKLDVPAGERTMLDVGGGHGWYSAQLCRRHPGLTATVLDLPGSARIGREIIAEAGMSDRVRHRDGDALTADLGGPYDLILCFNVVHHLTPEQIVALFTRLRAALTPDGSLAVMDGFADPTRRASAAGNVLGLFVYLSSGSGAFTPAQLDEWLKTAGFTRPRKVPMRRIPGLALYQSRPS